MTFIFETVKSFVHGILTGRTSTSKCAVKELGPMSTETENCKPPPKPEPKAKPQQQQQQQQVNFVSCQRRRFFWDTAP